MRRNLYNRVETVFPVIDPRLQRKVLRVLANDLKTTVNAWDLGPDREYHRVELEPDELLFNSQDAFIRDSFGLDITP
jgi:polyphosphate kinase